MFFFFLFRMLFRCHLVTFYIQQSQSESFRTILAIPSMNFSAVLMTFCNKNGPGVFAPQPDCRNTSVSTSMHVAFKWRSLRSGRTVSTPDGLCLMRATQKKRRGFSIKRRNPPSFATKKAASTLGSGTRGHSRKSVTLEPILHTSHHVSEMPPAPKGRRQNGKIDHC